LAIGEGAEYTPLVMRSHEIWREVEAETGAELLVRTGGLWISSSARQAETHVANFFDNTVAAARRFGIVHELLDAAAIRRRFPRFDVADNEVGYYEPEAGFLRPEACVDAHIALALAHGAELHCDERVQGFTDEGGRVRVRTDRGEYEARTLIVCAGAWLPELLPPSLARHFTITRQAMFWFGLREPIDPFLPANFPVWIWELQDRRNVIYGFPAIDGPEGGMKVATEQYAATTTTESVRYEITEEETRDMYERLVAPYMPHLGPDCVRAASCLYTATPDFQFVIDRHPAMPNVIIASPCSGHGFKHSPAVGEALAEMALDGRCRIDIRSFALGRFA